jgi:hypothetical protein
VPQPPKPERPKAGRKPEPAPVAQTEFVDESALTPEQRGKLHILRRVTGGRVPDAELLARLDEEAGAGARPDGDGKKKRRWFGG